MAEQEISPVAVDRQGNTLLSFAFVSEGMPPPTPRCLCPWWRSGTATKY